MNKIGEIKPINGDKLTVYYDKKAKYNPYKVYREWWGYSPHGNVYHKQMVAKYGNLHSCGLLIAKYTERFNEEGRG